MAVFKLASAFSNWTRAALREIQRLVSQEILADQIRKAAELTLRRAGLNRADAADVRDDARSLLQLLETNDRNDAEQPPAIGQPATEGESKPSP